MPEKTIRELRLLLPYLKRYRLVYLVGGACILGSTLLKLIIPKILGGSIDTLKEAEGSPADTDFSSLVSGAAIRILALAAAVALIRTFSRIMVLGTSRRAVHDVRETLFAHLAKLAPSFYTRHPIGHLMSRCVNDVQNIQGLMGPVFMYLSEVGVMYLICLGFMLSIDPGLTLIGLIPFPFFLFFARKQASRIQYGSRAAQEGLSRISARVDESLSGQQVIKTLTLEDFDLDRFSAECDDYRRLNLEVTRARATLMPMMMALGGLSTVIVLAVGGPKVIRGGISLGDFVTMIFYFQFMAAPTAAMGFVISSLQRGTAALARVREILEFEPALQDPFTPVETVMHGAIRVKDLSVDYPPPEEQLHLSGVLPEEARNGNGRSRRVLDRVSFEVPAGATLGIVGHTGSGKSTLMAALARQIEIDPGHVFFDGTDVTRMRLDHVRQHIGYVPQEAFLFSDTLAGNVALGRPDAPEGEVMKAVEAARLIKDLPQLPEGMETMLGERGVNLSGGQRQRTALARVMLLDPRILMLDDTLSAVDTQTAEEILDYLRPWMAGRTTIIVDHRISNLAHADKILVLEEGRIVEQGSHAELLKQAGRYAALYERQQLRQSLAADLGVDPEEDGA